MSLTVLLGCLPETAFVAALPKLAVSQHASQAARDVFAIRHRKTTCCCREGQGISASHSVLRALSGSHLRRLEEPNPPLGSDIRRGAKLEAAMIGYGYRLPRWHLKSVNNHRGWISGVVQSK